MKEGNCIVHGTGASGFKLVTYFPVILGQRYSPLWQSAVLDCGCEVTAPEITFIDHDQEEVLHFTLKDGLTGEVAMTWFEPKSDYE